MPKPEKLKTPEHSEQEEVIQSYQEEVESLKEELPLTKEEINELVDATEKAMDVITEKFRTLGYFKASIEKWINDAKAAWILKWNKKDDENFTAIMHKMLDKNNPEVENLFYEDDISWEYKLNPNSLSKLINNLDKKDRKFIKKTAKAIIKVREMEVKKIFKKKKK